MERLTYDFCIAGKHCWQVKGTDNLECGEVCKSRDDEGCNGCPIADAFDRLAAIEDILGDDYDLDRLKELVQADREGKVILRKTKEGSKVYIILLGRIFPFDVISATWNSKNAVYEAEHGKYLRYMFNDADIGISVFLTREEAEAALERMEGEEK